MLIPLTFGAARDWAEEHLSAEKYEAIFGEVTEDDSRRLISLSLPATAADTLKRLAAETGRTQSDLVAEMILKH